jgi:hypothetical protein
MTDDALIRAFEGGQEPEGGFHHAQHVRVAWWYLRQHPLPQALDVFRTRLRHFATVNGSPERYHETITTAYVLLIHERLASGGRECDWDAFAARHPELLTWTPSILERYYTHGTLWSDRARQAFVLPDREENGAWAAQVTGESPSAI